MTSRITAFFTGGMADPDSPIGGGATLPSLAFPSPPLPFSSFPSLPLPPLRSRPLNTARESGGAL